MSDFDFFLDQTFKLYRSKNSPVVTYEDESYIIDSIIQYLIMNNRIETDSKSDLLKETIINIQKFRRSNFNIDLISIRSTFTLLNVSIILVSKHEGHCLMFLRSGYNKFLIQILENLPQNQIIIVIQSIELSDEYIELITNSILQNFVNYLTSLDVPVDKFKELIPYIFGNIEIEFTIGNNSNINNIALNIPQKDLQYLTSNSNLFDNLYEFLLKTTTIKFDKLKLNKFISNLLFISISGNLKINNRQITKLNYLINNTRDDPHGFKTNYEGELILFILESMYNDNV